MRIIVLDYTGCIVETVPMTNDAINQYNMGEFDADEYLSGLGYNTSNCNWMVSDEDPIPVYTYGEVIPYTVI